MAIERVIIKGFKALENTDIRLNAGMSIIVGNNEAGKSTLLEAINLALSGQVNGRNVITELTPYLFNQKLVKAYVESVRAGKPQPPPSILIEIYFKDTPALAALRGTNNSIGSNRAGIKLQIELNEEFKEDYARFIAAGEKVTTLPVEYFAVRWWSFANNPITPRSAPVNAIIIDTNAIRTLSGADKYIANIIEQALLPEQRLGLALSYRGMRQSFATDKDVAAINEFLKEKKGDITDKNLTISVDVSSRSSWESSLAPYLDEIPFTNAGKGEQTSVKMKLALHSSTDAHVLLIEEPENHQSYGNMHRLVSKISELAGDRQVVISTHSSFVLNKLGVEKVILFSPTTNMRLSGLSKSTFDYFMKLPGHDTLRLILASKAILVEGPSDELIVQRAFLDKHNKSPLEAGIDVISVKSLAFKRFLDIAKVLKIDTTVITDNDGSVEKLKKRYEGYLDFICYDSDESAPTLEDQLVKVNSVADLNEVLGTSYATSAELIEHMKADKTDTALKVFSSPKKIEYPTYIADAVS